MSKDEFRLIGVDTQILHQDIHDHVVRMDEFNQSLRGSVDNAMAMYSSWLARQDKGQIAVSRAPSRPSTPSQPLPASQRALAARGS